jgi:hypothetical protein
MLQDRRLVHFAALLLIVPSMWSLATRGSVPRALQEEEVLSGHQLACTAQHPSQCRPKSSRHLHQGRSWRTAIHHVPGNLGSSQISGPGQTDLMSRNGCGAPLLC